MENSPYYGSIDGRCRCCCCHDDACRTREQEEQQQRQQPHPEKEAAHVTDTTENNAQRRRRFLMAVQLRKSKLIADGLRPREHQKHNNNNHNNKDNDEEAYSSYSDEEDDNGPNTAAQRGCCCTSSNCSCGSNCSCCSSTPADERRSHADTLHLLLQSQLERRRPQRRAPHSHRHRRPRRARRQRLPLPPPPPSEKQKEQQQRQHQPQPQQHTAFRTTKSEMLLSFYVGGMTCDGCAAALSDRLHLVPGIMEATVSFAARRADVWVHTEQPAAMLECLQVVEELGYRVLQHAPVAAGAALPPPSPSSAQAEAEERKLQQQQRQDDDEDNEDETAPTTVVEVAAPQKATLLIEGMSCASCAARIEAHLLTLPSVTEAVVSFSTCMGTVRTSDVAAVLAAVRELGYGVRDITPPSAKTPSTASAKAKGTKGKREEEEEAAAAAAAQPSTTRVHVPASGAPRAEGEGDDMTVTERTRSALERTQEIETQRRLCIGSFLLSIPLATSMVLMTFTSVMHTHPRFTFCLDLLQCLCATVMVLFFGKQFYVGAWRSFQHRTFTMDTLIATGTGCAYTYSLVSFGAAIVDFFESDTEGGSGARVYMPRDYYFDTAGMLLAFMLLGRYLEANAKRQTSSALISLLQLVPPTALVVQEEECDGDGAAEGAGTSPSPDGSGDAEAHEEDALLRRLAARPLLQVPSAEVRVGMRVMVRAGDRVPVDGTVLSGSSDVDEQMVTGESVPKWVRAGDRVVGGTTNLTATLLVRADRVGEATMLAQVLRIVQEAQNTKPAVQRVADRVAMYFVPCVVLLSLLTLLVWLVLGYLDQYPARWRAGGGVVPFALNFFIATIVAACPCALGLATPTAIMVGTGVGAQHGVLVKSGATLETVRRVNCVVFDKTGTLTTGKLTCVRQEVYHALLPAGVSADLARACVLAVEAQSNHPIALAVTATLRHHLQRKAERHQQPHEQAASGSTTEAPPPLVVRSAVTHSGLGVEAVLTPATDPTSSHESSSPTARWRVLVGNLALLEQRGIAVSEAVGLEVLQQQAHGRTTVVAAILPELDRTGAAQPQSDKAAGAHVCFLAALADGPKPEAAAVVLALQRRGIRTLMVTGDHRSVAGRVAREVGIPLEDVHAEALPTTKAAIVKQLQSAEGGRHRVLVAGDGINDSPALVQADAGVALGAGTEVAMEAADAVLVRNSLVDLLTLFALSRATVHRIYGNFVWALGYNALMLPLACGALFPLLQMQLPPMVAGAAMMLSSLSVLLSSLSLRCFRPYKLDTATGEVYQ